MPGRALTIAAAAASAAVVAVAAATAVGATARSSSAPLRVTTKGAIESLAMDGRRIAYDLEAEGACNTVHVLDTGTTHDAVVSGMATCEADSTSTGAGVRELTLAGRRVAWIVNLGGNTESNDVLYTATLGATREHRVASARRVGDADGTLVGSWLGNLAGDGDLIALNRWTTSGGPSGDASIRRLTTGTVRIHTGEDSLRVVAVDSGRLAVLGADGDVTVRDAAGAMLSTFTPSATAREVALRKDYVVVLEPGRLEVRLAATGDPVTTIAIPAGARDLDVHANIATFAIGRTVHAVRLATKRQVTLATAPKAIVEVQIDDAGVVYAYNRTTGVNGRGVLVFTPMSSLRL